MKKLICLCLLATAGFVNGAATDVEIPQRNASDRIEYIPITGSANPWEALGFNASGILSPLTLWEMTPSTGRTAGKVLAVNGAATALEWVTASSGALADGDYGDITVSGTGTAMAIDANAVALGTDTTGNYVATIADSGASEITVTGSGAESAAVTLAIASTIARDSEVAAGYQPLDADLTDLADGSLTGSKVGSGIDAGNITAGTVGSARLGSGTASASTYLRGDGTWATPAGSGDVSKVGTPVNNQVGVWTGDGTLEGDAAFTFDTATDTLTVPNLTVTTLNTTNLNADGLFLVEEEGAGTHTLEVYSPSTLSANRRVGFAVPDSDIEVTFTSSLTVAGTTTANNWADGIKQKFNPNGTNAGVNVGGHAGDPSTLENGDLWYDSTANELTARINGANVALGAGGPGGSVATDTIWAAKGDLAAATGNDAAAVLPVGTNGHVLAADSSTATGLKWVPPGGDLNTLTTYRQNPPILWEEWYNTFSGSGRYGDFGFIGTQTGSASSATVTQVSGDLTTPGILDLFTGTTTTGASTFISGGSGTTGAGINFGGGTYTFVTRVLVPVLADGTESYTVRLGFVDATAAESTDGVYFRYNQTNANWQTVCILNGLSTGTDEAVSSTVSANTWYKLRIVVSPTTALFYVNDTLVNTETANIPITTARSTSIGGGIVKSAGTTGRDLYMDYIGMQVSLTSAR